MVIPERFKLLGTEIKVIIKDDLIDKNNYWGQTVYREEEIHLANPKKHNISKPAFELLFLHELIHYILYKSGESKLNNDENKVELIACLLQQALSTMEGNVETDSGNTRKSWE